MRRRGTVVLDEEQRDDRFAEPSGGFPPVGGQAFRRVRRCRLGPSRVRNRSRDPHWSWIWAAGRGTEWYRACRRKSGPASGCTASGNMKAGLQFENVLKRGLLGYAFRLPDGTPEFRYVYHEVIEEAQHSLMFQEFVNRTGLETPGLTWELRLGSRRVVGCPGSSRTVLRVRAGRRGSDRSRAAHRPALGKEIHPLLERIMRIHVTEEARHLSFARSTSGPTFPSCPPVGGARSQWRRR